MRRLSKNKTTTSIAPENAQSLFSSVNENNHRSYVRQNKNVQLKEFFLKLQYVRCPTDSRISIYNQQCLLSLLSHSTISPMNQIKPSSLQTRIERNLTSGPEQNILESRLLQIEGELGYNCWLFPPDSFIIVPFEHFR